MISISSDYWNGIERTVLSLFLPGLVHADFQAVFLPAPDGQRKLSGPQILKHDAGHKDDVGVGRAFAGAHDGPGLPGQ